MKKQNAINAINTLKSMFKRGDIVILDGNQYAIFVCFGEGLTADLYFENGNRWLKDISRIEPAKTKTDFAKKLKLQFYGIRNFRRNFNNFLK